VVEEEHGVEGLVLGADRHARESEAGEKKTDLFYGRTKRFGAGLWEEADKAEAPVEIGWFGLEGEVLESASVSQQGNWVYGMPGWIHERRVRVVGWDRGVLGVDVFLDSGIIPTAQMTYARHSVSTRRGSG
jgi:hypothetical protein